MRKIYGKKINALENILKSYEDYAGYNKSILEKQIESLKNKISESDYNNLLIGFNCYKNYLFNAIANTRRVYIKLTDDEKIKEESEEDFEDLFSDFED